MDVAVGLRRVFQIAVMVGVRSVSALRKVCVLPCTPKSGNDAATQGHMKDDALPLKQTSSTE
jgi:hypothetical protein